MMMMKFFYDDLRFFLLIHFEKFSLFEFYVFLYWKNMFVALREMNPLAKSFKNKLLRSVFLLLILFSFNVFPLFVVIVFGFLLRSTAIDNEMFSHTLTKNEIDHQRNTIDLI